MKKVSNFWIAPVSYLLDCIVCACRHTATSLTFCFENSGISGLSYTCVITLREMWTRPWNFGLEVYGESTSAHSMKYRRYTTPRVIQKFEVFFSSGALVFKGAALWFGGPNYALDSTVMLFETSQNRERLNIIKIKMGTIRKSFKNFPDLSFYSSCLSPEIYRNLWHLTEIQLKKEPRPLISPAPQ